MVRASAVTTGATSVIEPTTVRRAASRARSRWRATWSRMMSACSSTLLANGIARARRGLVHHHRQRRLQRMREIADMGARALDDFLVGVDQRVGLARERRDLFGKLPGQTLGGAGADGGEAVGDALERGEAEAHLEHGGEQQHHGEDRKRDDQRLIERARLRR